MTLSPMLAVLFALHAPLEDEGAREAIPKAHVTLSRVGPPVQATISIEGRTVCRGLLDDAHPCTFEAEQGRHRVTLVPEEQEPQFLDVTVGLEDTKLQLIQRNVPESSKLIVVLGGSEFALVGLGFLIAGYAKPDRGDLIAGAVLAAIGGTFITAAVVSPKEVPQKLEYLELVAPRPASRPASISGSIAP